MSTPTETPIPSFTAAAISRAAAARRSGGVSARASARTVRASMRPSRVRRSWKCGARPAVRRTISSICVGKRLTPRRITMSSLRPVTFSMRRNVRAVPGSRRVKSRVR